MITIRHFQPGDEQSYRYLNVAWVTKYWQMEKQDYVTLENPRECILDRGGHILMAVDGEKPIGCCALIARDETTREVTKLAVDPAYQGQGIGKRIMLAVIDLGRLLGAKRLYLETNEILKPAIHVYESLGFTHVPPDRVTPSLYARANVFMECFLD